MMLAPKKARDPGQGGVARADERGISKVRWRMATVTPRGVKFRISSHNPHFPA